MAYYDYKQGKSRIESILKNKLEVYKDVKIPNDDNFTYENSYYGWVTAIFVDIRDSSSIFSNDNKVEVSKIIRSFSSEVIEILRDDENLREIGIRGDCVYSIYATPTQENIYDTMEKAIYINTFMEMLNKLLKSHNLNEIKVGIGISSDEELVIKAGRKGTGISNQVWIGDAVSKASNLSSLGNKNEYNPIVISKRTYLNFVDLLKQKNEEHLKSLFTYKYNQMFGELYHCNIVMSEFQKWISDGLK